MMNRSAIHEIHSSNEHAEYGYQYLWKNMNKQCNSAAAALQCSFNHLVQMRELAVKLLVTAAPGTKASEQLAVLATTNDTA
jgi:hypothetical protein